MKKLWIWTLSGVALILGSVSLVRCIHREQPCYYGPPIKESEHLEMDSIAQLRQQLQQRLDSIRAIVEERQNSEIYGPPEMMEEYARETKRLQVEADSIAKELENLSHE